MKNKKKKMKRTPEQLNKMFEKRRLKMIENDKKRQIHLQESIDKISLTQFVDELFEGWSRQKEQVQKEQLWLDSSDYGYTDSEKQLLSEFESSCDLELYRNEKGYRCYVGDDGMIILSQSLLKKYYLNQKSLYENNIYIDWIITNTDNRNSGWGTKMITLLKTLSNKYDVSLSLTSDNMSHDKHYDSRRYKKNSTERKYLDDENGLDNNQLRQWYLKMGFMTNPLSGLFYNNNLDSLKYMRKSDVDFCEWNNQNQLIYPSRTLIEKMKFTSILGYNKTYNFEDTSSCYHKVITGSYDRHYIDTKYNVVNYPLNY